MKDRHGLELLLGGCLCDLVKELVAVQKSTAQVAYSLKEKTGARTTENIVMSIQSG